MATQTQAEARDGERERRSGVFHDPDWADVTGTTVGETGSGHTLTLKVGTTGFGPDEGAVCLEGIIDRCARTDTPTGRDRLGGSVGDHPAERVARMRLGSAQVAALRDLLGHAAKSIGSR